VKHAKSQGKKLETVTSQSGHAQEEGFPVLTVIGVGLLGGSLALGLRQRGLTDRIIGVGRRRESLERALRLSVIDEYTLEIEEAVRRADLVVVATPANAACDIVRQIGCMVGVDTVVTDVASTKRAVVQAAVDAWPSPVRFVGSHPIAGSHRKGAEYARADLFEGATTIVTPDSHSAPQAVAAIERLWNCLGADTVTLSPQQHDTVLALTSHLPHLAASALMIAAENVLTERPECVGAGLADTTRVAEGDPEMWRDICLTNRDNIVDALERFIDSINRLRRAVNECDATELERVFDHGQRLRRKIDTDDRKG